MGFIRYGLFLIVCLTACSRSETVSPSSGSTLSGGSSPTSPRDAIVFAGISGNPPRFIDSGPEKGNGWVEYQTLEVRKGMRREGFNLVTEYMTPARIAHEFKIKSPICTFPYEWNNPKKFFAKAPELIVSVPLTVLGEENRSIVFHREDLPKFKRHMDQGGTINLRSLLSDQALKTVLIRNKDYKGLGETVLEEDSSGDQVVKKQYQKNIALLVVRDNHQIAEMLNAHRFDYTFADSLEVEDLRFGKVDDSRLMRVSIGNANIQGIQDPRLTFVSIACAANPITQAAIPHFNRWIRAVRGSVWERRNSSYRVGVDPSFIYPDASINLSSQLAYTYQDGSSEFWYPLQQAKVAGLKLYESPPVSGARASLDQKPHPFSWIAYEGKNDDLTLITTAETRFYFKRIPRLGQVQPYLYENLEEYLPEGLKFELTRFNSRAKPVSPVIQTFDQLKWSSNKKWKVLRVYGAGLKPSDLEKLKPILQSGSLEELTFFEAGPETARVLVSHLPKTLTSLNLTHSSLILAQIHKQIQGMPLKHLFLSSTQLNEDDLIELLGRLPQDIQSIALGHQPRAFRSGKGALAFAKIRWTRLKNLDIEFNALSNSDLRLIGQALPKGIESLRLSGNFFLGKEVDSLMSRSWPELRALELAGGRVIYRFPTVKHWGPLPKLEKIDSLSTANLLELGLSHQLKSVEIPEISKDVPFKSISPSLHSEIDHLSFSVHHSSTWRFAGDTTRLVKDLAELDSHTHIRDLNLSGLNLKDEILEPLGKARFRVDRLDLSKNVLGNRSGALIAKKWIKDLKELRLAENPMGAEGSRALVEAMREGLEVLDLTGHLDVDTDLLLARRPASLYRLDYDIPIEFGQTFSMICKAWDPSSNSLVIRAEKISAEDMAICAKYIPKRLKYLRIESFGPAQAAEEPVLNFLTSLPKTLHRVLLTIPSLTARQFNGLKEVFDGASNLRGLRVHCEGQACQAAVRATPASVEIFEVHGNSFGDEALFQIRGPDFPNLNVLLLNGSSITAGGLHRWVQGGSPMLNDLILFGTGISGGDLAGLAQQLLSPLRELFISSSPADAKSLITLVKRLNPKLGLLFLASLGLNAGSVDEFIQALPESLNYLSISGNPIGQSGLDKLRAYKQKKDKAMLMDFTLVE